MESSNLKVLYEDNHLIAVNKPAGLLVQGDDSGDESLMDVLKNYLKEKYQKPGNVFLGLIHRLDRNVSGIVLFAKTSKGASRLSEQFRRHTVKKIYHAWVIGETPASAKLTDYLEHSEDGNVTKVLASEWEGGKGEVAGGSAVASDATGDYAELSFTKIKTSKGVDGKVLTLLKIQLGTGRHHQIRAQLAHAGYPIVGDVKYGAPKSFSDQHLALMASELHFVTATEEKLITILLPLDNFLPDMP